MADFPSTPSQLFNALQISAQFIKSRLPPAQISLVLGSGLANFATRLQNTIQIHFSQIPFLPTTTVHGHKGTLYFGTINQVPVYCWGGRLHGYQGYYHYQISYIANLSAFLGCNTLLATNASGGAIPGCRAGDIAVLKDYISFYSANPLDTYLISLIGDIHQQFQLSSEIRQYAKEVASRQEGLNCLQGVYWWLRGPSFETPKEVGAYIALGGNIFGMSTVPEILAGLAHGMRVLTIACLSNLAAGLDQEEILSHDIVNAGMQEVQEKLENFFVSLITQMPPFTGEVKCEWKRDIQSISIKRNCMEISSEEIENAVEWIKNIIGNEKINFAIVINSQIESCFSNQRKLYYREIPGFPQLSLASRRGKITIGKFEGKKVAYLNNCSWEGLQVYESFFIIQVLIGLGVGHIHYLVPCLNSTEKKIINFDDYFSWVAQGVAAPAGKVRHISSLGEDLLIAFPGPSLPTEADKEAGRKIGGQTQTIANMSILNQAFNRGLSHSLSGYSSDYQTQDLNSEFLNSHISWLLSSVSQEQINLQHPIYLPVQGFQILQTPNTPEQLDQLSRILKQKHNDVILAVIVGKSIGKSMIEKTPPLFSYQFSSGLSQKLHFYQKTLIVQGSLLLKHDSNHQKQAFPYFLINRMGIKRALIIDSLSSNSIPVGSWVRVTDHIGLSFFNPLFGHNVAKWGTRFPNISQSYSFQFQWDLELKTLKNCQESVSLFTSPAKAEASRGLIGAMNFLGANSVAKNLVNGIVVLGHRFDEESIKEILTIGFVSRNMMDQSRKAQTGPEEIEALFSLISRLVSAQ